MEEQIGHVKLECIQGDIAKQHDVSVVVNAANAELKTGGGVAGALHQAAGAELAEAGRPFAPIQPGQAVITQAFNLPNDYVIHCLGPVYGKDQPEAVLLRQCYQHAIQLAEENNISSIAFPSISTGAFGYPIEEAAEIAVDEIVQQSQHLRSLKTIRFVLFSESDQAVYESACQSRMPHK
ncbi:O-acetyl-ADP-ribose deacetylase (regulator of RNase III), contains Macro domain [Alteribacillus persepolensis]|uniref:O-acetyl-ADP-ribose deacetylase (Regulator of RNase III), contains Macro domain n=1 Tax=Alteribacillus persepolensis TaxID=568899 RepID=A0A1G8GDK1_9BACI|nr:macro domain-containing protein [Alteribacillus persepolensis]SDH92468.1 O-acetyl-ADP-ribose deacetylase (regulator of RNase III), contains Macro domain [Alteribacillus persepolensis]